MKRLVILLIALTMSLAFAAKTQTVVGLYQDLKTGHPCYDITVIMPVNENVGIFAYGLTTEGFREYYAGPLLKPTENSEILIGVGQESNQKKLRYGGWSDITFGKTCLEYDYEFGGSGYWYKLKADYQLTDSINLNIINKTGDNTGIGVGYRINEMIKIRIETFPHRTIVGGTFSF